MSKIKNGGFDQYGAEPSEQQQFGTAGVEGIKVVTAGAIRNKETVNEGTVTRATDRSVVSAVRLDRVRSSMPTTHTAPRTRANVISSARIRSPGFRLPSGSCGDDWLPCMRQRRTLCRSITSYGGCLEVNREHYQNSSAPDCVTQCSQSTAHLCEQFLQVKQIGFVTLGPLRCA